MEPIVISRPYFFEGEIEELIALFDAGLQSFHIHKPGSDKHDLAKFLGQIPKEYRNRVMLHQDSVLVFQYELGGFHLVDAEQNEIHRDPKKLAHFVTKMKENGYKVTASIHDPKQRFDLPDGLDYILLSPVFDSISKPGYKRNENIWSISGVELTNKAPMIAMGGVRENNAQVALDHGFSGVAVLGSVWNESSPAEAWKRLRQVCITHATHML